MANEKRIRLADENTGAIKALAEDGVDVTVRVSSWDMNCGGRKLLEINGNAPTSNGPTETELLLQCGLFSAAAMRLDVSDLLDWLLWRNPDAVDEFVTWRMKQLDDEAVMSVLEGRDLCALGVEPLEAPVGRGPVSFIALKRALPRLSLQQLGELEAAVVSRLHELAA